jgi:hypothetical protein
MSPGARLHPRLGKARRPFKDAINPNMSGRKDGSTA